MKYWWALGVLVFVATISMSSSPVAQAAGFVSEHMMIDTVQLRGEASSGQSSVEMIQLVNGSAEPLDVTGWCVAYAASTSTSFSSKGCFSSPTDPWLHFLLPSLGSTHFITAEYQALHPEVAGAFTMTSGLGNTSGQVKLLMPDGVVVDHVGWGAGALAEAAPVVVTSSTVGFMRVSLLDTDNNANDFSVATLTLPLKPEAVVEAVDICHDIDGLQTFLPDGLELSGDGICQAPIIDSCQNLDGDQTIVPEGYVQRDDQCFAKSPLVITELLPNAVGSDTGAEFIELYNPGDVAVDLSLYTLSVGVDLSDDYQFDEGTSLAPGEFMTLYNSQLHFTLVNTQSAVRLSFFDGSVIDEVSVYNNPKEGESWARFDDGWSYTNQITPGASNLKSIQVVDETDTATTATTLAPCGPGKYRHPITNRCRSIESDTTLLVACDADEYRNPETNRCRKLTTLASTLTACEEGEERNPLTNRCRKISTESSALAECKPGQERNPLTNRCRTLPAAASAQPTVKKSSPSMTTNALLLASSMGAVSYGLFEWRTEFIRLTGRLKAALWRK